MAAVLTKLEVSTSGYYAYLSRTPSQQQTRRKELLKEIKQIHQDSKEIYGAPKITRILRKRGHQVSQRHVGKIMQENAIKAHYAKPWTKTTKNCDFSTELQNILARDFNPKEANRAWCTDITYIWTHHDEFVYLTSVMDLFSRKIIAWTLSRTMEVEEVLKCLEIAKERRGSDKPIVLHSDRGSQFVSKKYKELTESMIASYSRKGNCWDNACIEAFHAVIKREWLTRYKPENYEHCYQLVFEYIEGFYNTVRIHSHCDYISPNEYERKAISENNS